MRIYYIGHAAFYVDMGVKLLFDPWIEGNPLAKPIDEKVDYIFVSHGHADHGLKDAIGISKKYGAPIVGVFELCNEAARENAKTLPGNIGGLIKRDDVEIYITKAFHTCPYGNPAGFIVKHGDEVIYHAGDTGLFGDMKLLGELYDIDVALLPIGGTYTMSVREAEIAAKLLKAKHVIPMHYNTFPAIKANPHELGEKLPNVHVVSPGSWIEL